MFNLTEQTVRIESSFNIPKYLYALSNLTWALIRVHKIKLRRIHLSRRVRFK